MNPSVNLKKGKKVFYLNYTFIDNKDPEKKKTPIIIFQK